MKYFLILSILLQFGVNLHGQNGNIKSIVAMDITKSDFWSIISQNDTLNSDYQYSKNLNYSEFIYQSDSNDIKGLLIAPKAKGNYPLIIFNRGGNRDYNELTLKMLFFSTAFLANEGYIILASNYRVEDEYGGNDLKDVLNLIHVAAQIENVDTSSIGMFGWSRGGMMTYLALKASNRIKTAVIGNGATDLFSSIKNRPELETSVLSECIPNYWNNKTEALTKRSAIYWADSLNKKSSLLLLCGSLDAQVDHKQSVNMASKLDSLNYNYQLKIYETNHGFRGKRSELNEELINWFNAHLRNVPTFKDLKIALTIDDVPNTSMFKKDNHRSHLLEVLDSLDIPVSIFINEGLLFQTSDTSQNLVLLEDWVKKEYVTIGNHTFSHLRYSDVGYERFKTDFENGEIMTAQLANKYNKPLRYFRFPYNDLGNDSIQHVGMSRLLASMSYKIAPFTVESSDWMFNAIYEYYRANSAFDEASTIGENYVSKTIDYIHFFDSLANTIYGRNVNQIYLCHDNAINAKYLKKIVYILSQEGYQFVSLDDAVQDSVYEQENEYFKKWGVSWYYRWMSTQKERRHWMELEPSLSDIETWYNKILNKG